MSDIAVVIGNYRGEQLLPDCLASLREQTQPPVEVIVADADGSARGVSEARVLACENRGLGSLYNRGAEAAGAPYVLFLNNDVALERECVERLAAALDADEARFAADARQLDWSGERTIHARTTLRRGRLVREYLPGLHLEHDVPADGVVETVCANGAAMLVRRDNHLELGGFDETFFLEWEDLDLCWRAWLRGWPTVYVPDAALRHRVGAATSAAITPRREASSHHNLLRFALKCLPAPAAARVVAGELLRLPRHPPAIARALGAAAKELPEIARIRREIRPSAAVFEALIAGRAATLGRG
jgi:GT2 family glycosyltransferase